MKGERHAGGGAITATTEGPKPPAVALKKPQVLQGGGLGRSRRLPPLSSGIRGPASDVLSLPYDDGRRLYIYSLAEILSFPPISLGERDIDGSPVSVGVPRGRFAWEQVVRFWPSDMWAS